MSDPNPNSRLSKRTLLILLVCGAVLYSSIVTAIGFFVLRQRPGPPQGEPNEVAPPAKVEPQSSAQLSTSTGELNRDVVSPNVSDIAAVERDEVAQDTKPLRPLFMLLDSSTPSRLVAFYLKKVQTAWRNLRIRFAISDRDRMDELQSRMIVDAIYRRHWISAWRLARAVPWLNALSNPDFAPTESRTRLDRQSVWAQAIVIEHVPSLDDGTVGVLPAGLRHPLISPVNKSAYNRCVEIQSALAASNLQDAARLLVSMGSDDQEGVIPVTGDPERFVSMSTWLASIRRGNSAVTKVVQEQHATQGLVRVRSAIHEHDVEAVRAATFQFAETDAASEAHLWLGDQAMTIGDFSLAEWHYEQGATSAVVSQKKAFEIRLILSEAFLRKIDVNEMTRRVDGLFDSPVHLNGKTITRFEFASIVHDLKERPAPRDRLRETFEPDSIAFPSKSLTLEKRAEFDGPAGHDPGRWDYRFGDPFGRQIAVRADEERIYISNRFHIEAYSSETGASVWSQVFPGEQGDAYAMALTPMRPLVCGDRLFVRHLKKAGSHLACLDSGTGDVIWNRMLARGAVSDPVIWDGQLFVLLLSKRDDDQLSVDAAWIDPATGDISQARPLFGLSDTSGDTDTAQILVTRRRAFLTIGGSSACIDWQGNVVWLRRHLLMRRPIDELSVDSRSSLPIVDGNCLIVAQPGVRLVSALDQDSGRVVWEHPVTNIRGLLGLVESFVIVDTTDGLLAIDAANGEIRWKRSIQNRMEGFAIHDQSLIIATREPVEETKTRPAILRLDLKTGVMESTFPATTTRREYQLGPLFHTKGKWWCLVGDSWNDQRRDLYEVVATSLSE